MYNMLSLFLPSADLHARRDPDAEYADVDKRHKDESTNHQPLPLLPIVKDDSYAVDYDL